jgi:hypothetical protein
MDGRRFQEAIRALAGRRPGVACFGGWPGAGPAWRARAGTAAGRRGQGRLRACKSRPLGSTRCQYDCTPRECYVCDANSNGGGMRLPAAAYRSREVRGLCP